MSDMNSKNIIEEETETTMQKTVLLNIPPQLQWDNDNGYCGGAALQSIDLYYSAWISQKLIRDINKGVYLLQPVTFNDHRDPLRTLTLLHFTYNEWDRINSPQPQFREEFGATRETINDKEDADDGCLPLDIDYGIAITGIVDEDSVTLPVRLSVSEWNEPNPRYHEAPKEMLGTVTVNNLTNGCFYALLQYSSYGSVPTRGSAIDFLQSDFDERHEFMATSTDYVYEDPNVISTNGSVYYRCVLIPE
ncbi:unnamed protein product [Adineta steineri]|uniref:Uncharacterized protein n=1 Tax=Adineta steineri TaxID=433720 RepID=A0A814J4P7_9BILA|nr:unnamed protein product [Adineta steineri]